MTESDGLNVAIVLVVIMTIMILGGRTLFLKIESKTRAKIRRQVKEIENENDRQNI